MQNLLAILANLGDLWSAGPQPRPARGGAKKSKTLSRFLQIWVIPDLRDLSPGRPKAVPRNVNLNLLAILADLGDL